jgi:hypothetical protein
MASYHTQKQQHPTPAGPNTPMAAVAAAHRDMPHVFFNALLKAFVVKLATKYCYCHPQQHQH